MTPDFTIERVDVTPIDIPLTDEFVISRGRIAVAENAFVSVTLRSGATGWGEIAPFPALTGETRDGSVAAVRELLSTAMDRREVAGRVVKSATDATSPSEATAGPGTIR